MEGGEINVLEGMMKKINNHKPILMYEIDDRKKRIFQEKMNKIDSFVSDIKSGGIGHKKILQLS
ncbi:MAG: hypothetical protein F6K22_08065 [Okeania sp. SIO2F4]|nr:hypothetical protein [Okeania sp. SIO2F4]